MIGWDVGKFLAHPRRTCEPKSRTLLKEIWPIAAAKAFERRHGQPKGPRTLNPKYLNSK